MKTLISADRSPIAMTFKAGASGQLKKVCKGQALMLVFRRRGSDYVQASSKSHAG